MSETPVFAYDNRKKLKIQITENMKIKKMLLFRDLEFKKNPELAEKGKRHQEKSSLFLVLLLLGIQI